MSILDNLFVLSNCFVIGIGVAITQKRIKQLYMLYKLKEMENQYKALYCLKYVFPKNKILILTVDNIENNLVTIECENLNDLEEKLKIISGKK